MGNAILVKNEYPRLQNPVKNGKFHIACYECDVMMGYDTDYGGQFMSKKKKQPRHGTIEKEKNK